MSSLLDVIDEECGKEINAYCELFEKDKDKGPIQPVAATVIKLTPLSVDVFYTSAETVNINICTVVDVFVVC